ncbi:MAG: Wzy polymerase domain-containing protein [Candidatus Bipolaricaulis sp.]|nr:Wzy polymerase domain-containing protein [Candidatus Bipolaricaulis sp.]
MAKPSALRFDRLFLYALAFVIFALPLFIWPGITEYGYGKTIVATVAVSILSAAWGIDAWRRGAWEIRIPWVAAPIGALVAASLFSLLTATSGRVVVQSLVLVLVFFQLLMLVQHAARDKRDATLLLFSFLASTSLVSLYALLQYLGVMQGPTEGVGLEQIIATLGNKEYLGGLLAYVVFPSIVLLLRLRSSILRGAALVLIAFNFGTLMLVQQTGPIVGLILGVVILLVLWIIFRPVEPLRAARRWLVALVLLLAFTFLVEAPSGPLNSVVGLSADGTSWIGRVWAENSGRTRSWDWWIGLEMLKDHPITGVGLGNYKIEFVPYKAKFLATPRGAAYDWYIPRAAQAHNDYVQVAAELGTLGVLALAFLVVLLPMALWLRVRRNPDEGDRMDLLLYSTGLATLLVHAFVSFPAHLPVSMLAGVLFCGLAWSPGYGTTATWKVTLRGWPLRSLVLAGVAAGLVVSVVAVRDLRANVLMGRGIAQLQGGAPQLALATLEESERLDFSPQQTYFYLGATHAQLGNRAAAVAYLERCFTRFVDEAVYLAYAELATREGKTKEAREKIEVLIASRPHEDMAAKARFLDATISIQEKDYATAMDKIQRLVADAPKFEPAWIALGNLYLSRGSRDEARAAYERALQLIGTALASAEGKLAYPAGLTAAEYADLRGQAATLRSERDFVQERLKALGAS